MGRAEVGPATSVIRGWFAQREVGRQGLILCLGRLSYLLQRTLALGALHVRLPATATDQDRVVDEWTGQSWARLHPAHVLKELGAGHLWRGADRDALRVMPDGHRHGASRRSADPAGFSPLSNEVMALSNEVMALQAKDERS